MTTDNREWVTVPREALENAMVDGGLYIAKEDMEALRGALRVANAAMEAPPPPTTGDGGLREAATALVEKLNLIHHDVRYFGVWQCAQNHIGPYQGPKYEKELRALEAALGPAAPPNNSSYEALATTGEQTCSATKGEAVYLVASGETKDGRELYERYDGAPPPLCDYEKLHSIAGGVSGFGDATTTHPEPGSTAGKDLLPLPVAFVSAGDELLYTAHQMREYAKMNLRRRDPAPSSEADIAALVTGMSVSVDVSTGDDDADHRVFGKITEAMRSTDHNGRPTKHGVVLLVQDAIERNFEDAQPSPASATGEARERVLAWLALTAGDDEDVIVKCARNGSADHVLLKSDLRALLSLPDAERVERAAKSEREVILFCPFCGGQSELRAEGEFFYVTCDPCGTMTSHYVAPNHAVDAWNKRPAEVGVPEGWVLVPREPTEAMLVAALEATDPLGKLTDWQGDNCNTRDAVRDAYVAMLLAANTSKEETK